MAWDRGLSPDRRFLVWTGVKGTVHVKQLPQGQTYEITRSFEDCSVGLDEEPSTWKIVKLFCVGKRDAEFHKEMRSDRFLFLRLERKRTGRMDATARGRNGRYQVPTFPIDDGAAAAETLGMVGRQRNLLARRRERIHAAHRQHAHQDGI